MNDWRIFKGNSPDGEPIKPHNDIEKLPPPPKWRQFIHSDRSINLQNKKELKLKQDRERGERFFMRDNQDEVIDAVNAALYLRRPLLITGRPGSGKTSLAYAVAYQLKLGQVLKWSITVRSTIQEALYQYDAIARLQDTQIFSTVALKKDNNVENNIGQYIKLGPLGTAFLPSSKPRILLIDEIDKADINLPNDLLNLFEEGEFEIPELVRISQKYPRVELRSADDENVSIEQGYIRCQSFPLVILTSNGERDFPPAFLRRCIRVRMPDPTKEDLLQIVQKQLDAQDFKAVEKIIADFVKRRDGSEQNLATDQLLNTIYLLAGNLDGQDDERIKDLLLSPLVSSEDDYG